MNMIAAFPRRLRLSLQTLGSVLGMRLLTGSQTLTM